MIKHPLVSCKLILFWLVVCKAAIFNLDFVIIRIRKLAIVTIVVITIVIEILYLGYVTVNFDFDTITAMVVIN